TCSCPPSRRSGPTPCTRAATRRASLRSSRREACASWCCPTRAGSSRRWPPSRAGEASCPASRGWPTCARTRSSRAADALVVGEVEGAMPFESVFVTGASSGMGRGLALHYARLGATVHAAARRKEMLDTLQAEAGEGRIVPVELDVQD